MPPLRAEALDGSAVTLPDPHQPTLLILGFTRKAGDGVMAWSKVLSHTSWNNKAATVYELGFLGDVPRPVRGWIVRSLRKQVPEAARRHFLTTTDSADAWKKLAAVQDENQPALLLIERSGIIRWRRNAPYSDSLAAEVEYQVSLLR